MSTQYQKSLDEIITILKKGGIAIIPTDTLYGIACSAQNPPAVARIYSIKNRDTRKPLIVAIPTIEALTLFDIDPTPEMDSLLNHLWPGPVSIIIPCISPTYEYLHRNTGGIAFRIPRNEEFRTLLLKTGPLCVPSANREGEPPAETLENAYTYFATSIDGYLDGGLRSGEPSTLIEITSTEGRILREGSGDASTILPYLNHYTKSMTPKREM